MIKKYVEIIYDLVYTIYYIYLYRTSNIPKRKAKIFSEFGLGFVITELHICGLGLACIVVPSDVLLFWPSPSPFHWFIFISLRCALARL